MSSKLYLSIVCTLYLLIFSLADDEESKMAEQAFYNGFAHNKLADFVLWPASQKLTTAGLISLCQQIHAQMNTATNTSTFFGAKMDGGMLRFKYHKNDDMLIEVLVCKSEALIRSEVTVTPPDVFYVTRSKDPNCVNILEEVEAKMKDYFITRQVCNITVPTIMRK